MREIPEILKIAAEENFYAGSPGLQRAAAAQVASCLLSAQCDSASGSRQTPRKLHASNPHNFHDLAGISTPRCKLFR
jgi:hypothetical protein